jgi:hypothetical protein
MEPDRLIPPAPQLKRRTVRTLNWIFVSLAFVVAFTTLQMTIPAARHYPLYLRLVETASYTLFCAIPAIAAHAWVAQRRPPRSAYHIWTLGIALLLAWGRW